MLIPLNVQFVDLWSTGGESERLQRSLSQNGSRRWLLLGGGTTGIKETCNRDLKENTRAVIEEASSCQGASW